MVWQALENNGKVTVPFIFEGNMNAELYANECLKKDWFLSSTSIIQTQKFFFGLIWQLHIMHEFRRLFWKIKK